MSSSRSNPWSTGGGLLAILLWSTTFALARSLIERLGPLTAAAAVYLIGGGLCLVRLWWIKTPVSRLLRLPRKYLLGCGALFIAYAVFIYLAVGLAGSREQVLEISLVNYLWPAFTLLLSLPLLRQRASALLVPGTALALTGVFLVMTQGAGVSWASFGSHLQANPVAYGLAFLAAVSWGLYSNLARRWAGADASGAVELFIPAAGLVLLALSFMAKEPAAWNAQAAVEAGALGAITALAYALWELAMRKGDLSLVVACSYFTPLLSTVVSCAYLNVAPGPRLWGGCGLIVIGSLLSWRSVSERGGKLAEGK